MIRYAVISDIHGNRWALETVLKDIKDRGIQRIINLGDSVYGPLDPAGTAEMIMGQKCNSVLGNEDMLILHPGEGKSMTTLRYVLDHLGKEHIEWLREIPPTLIIDDSLFACHATPESDIEYFFWNVSSDGVVMHSRDEMQQKIDNIEVPVILCGHDHIPQSARLRSGTLIVNPGSVGLPAFEDDIPHPHMMQAGSPHARYAIISGNNRKWTVEQMALEYDWEAAAIKAAQNGRQDWASWIRTGKACAD